MENASKAILIAGGVLLGVLLLAFLIFFWTNMSTFVAGGSGEAKEQQIAEFNQEFETFNRGQTERKTSSGASGVDKDIPVYGSDIITIVNKIETYNKDPQNVFNGKVQYKNIDVKIKLGQLGSGGSKPLELFKTVPEIKDAANNPNFMKYNEDGTISGKIAEYVKMEQEYGKDFINKLSANYDRLLKLMHIDENYNKQYNIQDDNDPEEYGYVGAVKKLTGRNMQGSGGLKATDNVNDKGIEAMKKIKNYSDYTAFKSSQFICTGTNYDSKTGQIIEMKFEFSRR